MEADLIDRGLRLRDLGTPDFAWSDLRAIVNTRMFDSALSRSMDPDGWFWNDMRTLLAAESATILSSLRWWEAVRASTDETDFVKELGWSAVQYGPRTIDDVEDESSDVGVSADDAARAAAAEILG